MSAFKDAMTGKGRPTTVTEGPALWRGEVVEVLATGLVWVMIPRMAGTDPVGPINATPPGLVPGDRVIVGAVGGDVNDLFVLSRAAAPAEGPPAWEDVTGKPSVFPPAAHTHDWGDVTGTPATYPPSAHSHVVADVVDFPATMPPSAHTHPWEQVTGKPTTFPAAPHTHVSTDLADATATGRSLLTATDAATARVAIGAGTSSLALGTTAGTAMRGDKAFSYGEITGLVPTAALPPLAVIETYTVNSQAEMLALDAQRGDVAIRTDSLRTFVLSADTPTVLTAWKEIMAAGQVTSVNGKTGTVSLTKADVGLGSVDNTTDANKPVSTATQTALNGKANVIHTHDITAIISGTMDWARMPVPTSIPTNVNLDTFTNTQTCVREFGSGATIALNYPADGLPGLLEVASLGLSVYQRYTARGDAPRAIYTRGKYDGTWYPWVKYTGV